MPTCIMEVGEPCVASSCSVESSEMFSSDGSGAAAALAPCDVAKAPCGAEKTPWAQEGAATGPWIGGGAESVDWSRRDAATAG